MAVTQANIIELIKSDMQIEDKAKKIENWIDEANSEGFAEGRQEGYDEGYDAGTDDHSE